MIVEILLFSGMALFTDMMIGAGVVCYLLKYEHIKKMYYDLADQWETGAPFLMFIGWPLVLWKHYKDK